QKSIMLMDALKLHLCAKNRLPILYTWYARFKESNGRDGKSHGWLVLWWRRARAFLAVTTHIPSHRQWCQLLFGVDYAYAELSRSLGGDKSDRDDILHAPSW
ncbi:VPS28-domain-containing protein, partial [Pisolithus croceorrhizus]